MHSLLFCKSEHLGHKIGLENRLPAGNSYSASGDLYIVYVFHHFINYLPGSVLTPALTSQVSLLWQYIQRKGQPCMKTTNLIPGPSSVPKDSNECILPFNVIARPFYYF